MVSLSLSLLLSHILYSLSHLPLLLIIITQQKRDVRQSAMPFRLPLHLQLHTHSLDSKLRNEKDRRGEFEGERERERDGDIQRRMKVGFFFSSMIFLSFFLSFFLSLSLSLSFGINDFSFVPSGSWLRKSPFLPSRSLVSRMTSDIN